MKHTYKGYFLSAVSMLLMIVLMLSSGCSSSESTTEADISNVPSEEWSINSATWQDRNNIVLEWDASYTSSYKIYRMNEADEYELIGESYVGSFRDGDVVYPNEYTYKVEKIFISDEEGTMSEPIVSGTNPQKIYCVPVIMYHNFITEEDEAEGVIYEEYTIRPEDFEEDLVWLKDNGYTTITSRELVEYLSEKSKVMPEKPIIISIDDGTWGVYKNAWPLLKKYGMKADFNVIGRNIDNTWDNLKAGGTRVGETAPYCTWEELKEMSDSGEINVCSHTYGLHVYNRKGRIGMDIVEGESIEDYIQTIKDDYELAERCIGGWLDKDPVTVAYPYSKRHEVCDDAILNNTGYLVLMGGDDSRKTMGNYFVEGCDFENQLMIMSRPCRMDGSPVSEYLEEIIEEESTLFSE